MKINELRNLKKEEKKKITSLIFEKKLELNKIQVKIATGKEKNLKLVKNLRKDIAQLLTILK